jgi:hypothetical protein
MTDHEKLADAAERELQQLRDHSAEVGEEIKFAKENFAETDEMPPSEPLQGAIGKNPEDTESPAPETQYTSKD